MPSTHFIYGYMVKEHSASEIENPMLPHGLLFPISSKSYMHHPTDRITDIPQPLLHEN